MKCMTKKAAREVIRWEREHRLTNYFEGTLRGSDMKEMLCHRMGFGDAEANFIIASMVNAGAKFIAE